MTKILIDRSTVEQALHVATGAGYPVALIAALKAALAEPEPPIGKASTDVGVPVYVVKKAEPQEPDYWQEEARRYAGNARGAEERK